MNTEIKSLYRVYRPKSFGEIVGQEFVTKTLINQIKNNKIGHAYLFCGTRGTGKTSVAKIFANAINCEHFAGGHICGKCEWCENPNKNLDIIEIDAASNNGVDAVRDLVNAVKYTPVAGKYKVYIIDEVHMFSGSAFNALLKTLEEPPSHVVFILATTEPHKLLPTVQSRCMRFNFRSVSVEDISAVIRSVFAKENIAADNVAIEKIAACGRGSVRDALSFADTVQQYCSGEITVGDVNKVMGEVDASLFEGLLSAIADSKIDQIRPICDRIFDAAGNTDRIVANMLSAIKDNYMKAPSNKIANALKIFAELEMAIKHSAAPKEYFETAAFVAAAESSEK